jgi:hypothetical protein
MSGREREAVPSRLHGIGGDFALDLPELCQGEESSSLFATGRDALAAVVQSRNVVDETWLVPEFICRVVPETLRGCRAVARPYPWLTPWSADLDSLQRSLPGAAGIIVPYYLGHPPTAEIWETLAGSSLCVVEDRCQCVGRPPSPENMRGDYAIGSFRKWLPVPDGGYCVRRNGPPLFPRRPGNRIMVRLRLAAALVKQTRSEPLAADTDRALEAIGVELFRLGEAAATAEGRRSSHLTEERARQADVTAITEARIRNQKRLAERLAAKTTVRLIEPWPDALAQSEAPLLAVPVLCADRQRTWERLASDEIFCAIHWKDADWSGAGRRCGEWAAHELSLPIDQRYDSGDMDRILKALE